MANGGIIGADNQATKVSAPGVWTIDELYAARVGGRWPEVAPGLGDSIIQAVMNEAVGDVSGVVVTDFRPVHPVGNTEGRFTVTSLLNNEITISTSGQPPGHQLAVDDEIFFTGDEADMPGGIVVDTPYFVESVPSATVFTISATQGGSQLNITSTGTDASDRRVFKRPGSGDPSIELEIYHVSAATAPAGLTIDSLYEVGEDADEDFRITALVVDRDLIIDTGGTLRITNNCRRLGFMIASRENITIGPGTWTIPNFQNVPSPNPGRGHTQFRRHLVDARLPYTNGYLIVGGNGGAGGNGAFNPFVPGSSGGGGGGGGSSFGGTAATGGAGPASSGNPGNATAGGTGGAGVPPPSPGFMTGPGGSGGGLPGANSTMRNLAIVYGNDITIPGPGPTVRINAAGAAGANGSSPPTGNNFGGGGGGGGAGGNVYILHAGAYTNNATISVAGGNGGSAGSSAPGSVGATSGTAGSTGTIVTVPVPAVI